MRANVLQLELFPEFVPQGERAPKLALPWSEREEIDSQRAAKILGVSLPTMRRMLNAGCMRYYSLSGKESSVRILYESLVQYCDQLRVHFLIPARHTRQPGRRLRDDQVLPFPLSETITVDEVRLLLHCSDRSVVHLIDSGEIQAYRLLMGDCTTKWRINLPSVERYIAKLHRMAAPKQYAASSLRSESSTP